MFRARTADGVWTDAAIECHQPTAVADRQRQQIGIGRLTMSQEVAPLDHSGCEYAHISRPEFVVRTGAGLGQSFGHDGWGGVGLDRRDGT